MAPIRIGIVGMGAAGWAFVPAIRGNPAFKLAAIAEPDPAMRQTAAGETGAAPFADLPAMLRDGGLDAVYIATPTELHPEHVAQVCAAKKHVLTEKPMAIRVEQAQQMVDAAARAGRSEEHTSELQSRRDLVCRLLLEKKKKKTKRRKRQSRLVQ